jgi:hypothetical protein
MPAIGSNDSSTIALCLITVMPVCRVSCCGSLHLPAVDKRVGEQDDEDDTDGENTPSPFQRGHWDGSPIVGFDVNCVGGEDNDADCQLEDVNELEGGQDDLV